MSGLSDSRPTNEEVGKFWETRWKTGDTPWDHGAYAPPFAEFIDREGAPEGSVLIPGPGSGHDVRFFAEKGARVTGLDVSPSAVEVAQRVNAHENARYLVGNVLAPEAHLHGQFDWVIEHTCLCALPPACRKAYAAAIPQFLAPNGYYLAIFYRQPQSPEGPPFGIEGEEIDSLFAEAFELLQAWIPSRAFPSRVGREEVRWYRRRS